MIKKLGVIFMSMFLVFNSETTAEKTRSFESREEIDQEYKWDLTDVYKSDEKWEQELDELQQKMQKLSNYEGKLAQSSQKLLECLELKSNLKKKYSSLSSYAQMKYDQDTKVSKYQAMKQKVSQVGTDFSSLSSFIEPEILQISKQKIEKFLKKEEGLDKFAFYLKDLMRRKDHYRSSEEEQIIANTSLISGGPSSVRNIFSNADFPYPTVELSNGEEAYLNSAGYSRYRDQKNREDRIKVFESFFGKLNDYRRTYGTLLKSQMKKDYFYTKVRNYESCLKRALDANNIPVKVYHTLIENVNDNLDTFHRYLKLKRDLLGVDTLKYYDLYAPVMKDVDVEYSYGEARELIMESLNPLGKDYKSNVKTAFENRWIDVYPYKGKRSGAYSNGSIYEEHPYILLNYNGSYSDVGTVIHELGHAMHSYYSNKNQPYPTSQYAIFVAEVASTLNEILLFHNYYESLEDKEKKLSALMNYLDGIKGTVFRQTQFAEFELKIHQIVEQGKPLTGQKLNQVYEEIVKKYYGHSKNVCRVPEYIKAEWAYIPHFYYNFYVYQYATSYTAATALSKKILNGNKKELKNYKQFLSAGGSDYPIEILKEAGADLTKSKSFKMTMEEMNWTIDQIRKLSDDIKE